MLYGQVRVISAVTMWLLGNITKMHLRGRETRDCILDSNLDFSYLIS
jgi:hypothetical protein